MVWSPFIQSDLRPPTNYEFVVLSRVPEEAFFGLNHNKRVVSAIMIKLLARQVPDIKIYRAFGESLVDHSRLRIDVTVG